MFLALTKSESDSRRGVWLENKSTKDVSLHAGTYLGKAGPGKFVALVNTAVDDAMKPFMWRWTRITSFKSDKLDEYTTGSVFLKRNRQPLATGSRSAVPWQRWRKS